ncbi:MAG: DNA replication/repair protein RecF [Pseudomonadota bacterium]
MSDSPGLQDAPQVGAAPDASVRAAGRVAVSALTLTDFRSYASLRLETDTRSVVLVGPNGAGKTNILEALSLLGPGRGLRRAKFAELPRQGGAGGWGVSATLSGNAGETQAGVGVPDPSNERRITRIDGATARGPGALGEYVRPLWLTPAMDRLFTDGASERRRFLDRMALAHDPAHGTAASSYEKAMRERQRLLNDGVRDDRWLAALEAQMAEAGVAVAAARAEMTARLFAAQEAAIGAEEGPFPAADIALEGRLEEALAEDAAADVEDAFAARLADMRRRDAEAGRALDGPHRSDLLVRHRAKDQEARLCSTGEQKALLVGLVLANAQALAAAPGGAPLLLLLDEIGAHLDDMRRAALFDRLEALGLQAWMTGTDENLFEAWGVRAQRFEIKDGAARALA